jgi:cell division protein FtsN
MSQFTSLFKTNDKAKTETKPKAKGKSQAAKAAKKKTDASPSPAPTTPAAAAAAVKQSAVTNAAAAAAKPAKRSGKSSDPNYTQALTYLRRDTHNRVKAALIFDDARRDLSDLVEELLAGWLEKNSR